MKIKVLGAAQTKFGELWDASIADLLAESQCAALDNAGLSVSDVDAIVTGNMCAGIFSNQVNLGSLAAEVLGLFVPSLVVEGACASGGLALQAGIAAIESGRAKVVLVNGVEKMTDIGVERVTEGIMAASCAEREQMYGATFPALSAMLARMYMEMYGVTREELARVSVESHAHGLTNRYAHIRKKITVEDVLGSPPIADPLRLLDCSPISDGAASIVLCGEDFMVDEKDRIHIIGSGGATDTLALASRRDLLTFDATVAASKQAFEMAEVTHEQVDYVELHDAFSILHLLSLEDLGFVEKGCASREPLSLVVNRSGGLKSKGHPVGATGVAQVVAIVEQLEQDCNARIGMTHNMGGCGANVVVHLFEKGDR